MRSILALGLLVLLFIVTLMPYFAVFFGGDLDKIKDLLELTLTPTIGLVGAVTGFYYGSKSKD